MFIISAEGGNDEQLSEAEKIAGSDFSRAKRARRARIRDDTRKSSYGHAVTRSVTQPRRKPRYVFAVILAGRNESGYARRHTYPAAGGNYHRHPCKNLPTRHPRRSCSSFPPKAGITIAIPAKTSQPVILAAHVHHFRRRRELPSPSLQKPPNPSSSPAGGDPAMDMPSREA